MVRNVGFPLLLLVFLSASLAFGGAVSLLQAHYNSSQEQAARETANKTDGPSYELYRKASNQPAFGELAAAFPINQARYPYLAPEAARSSAGSSSKQRYPSTSGQTPGAVQRSWNSVKSLFR